MRVSPHASGVLLALAGGFCWAQDCALINGGFESSTPFEGWVALKTPEDAEEFIPWRIETLGGFFWPEVGPYEGEHFAQNGFDGDAGLVYELYQEVFIPPNAEVAILEWADRIQWDLTLPNLCDPCLEPRVYQVSVQPEGGGAPLLLLHEFLMEPLTASGEDAEYVFHAHDLLEWIPEIRGSTVRLHWLQYVPETRTGPAQFDLDAVCLRFTHDVGGAEGEPEGEGEGELELEGEGEGEWETEGEGEITEPLDVVYVDFRNAGFADGSAAHPYARFLEGANQVPVGGTVRIAPGDYDEQVRIGKAMRLEALGGSVRVGIP